MNGKTAILAKIRSSLKASPADPERKAAVQQRLARHPAGVIPQRGQLPMTERIDLFRAMAARYQATTERISQIEALPSTVSRYLKQKNLPAAVRIGWDPRLAAAMWAKERTLEIRRGASDGQDLAAVSHAFAAVAESGTLALLSGPDNPVTLTFLPDHHIVVVDARDIAGDMETVFSRLRQITRRDGLPRTLNFVTGPSRSGDIEQVLLLGAHGPRALHIVIVDEA